jgi:anthraniloyl-CoA monooxygenase
MRIVCVGGGPGGLYFAVLMKKANPDHDIVVIERNRPEDTFGFGVVFSDATMAGIAEADSEAYGAIAQHLVHWNDIKVHHDGETVTSTGHGFSGMSRQALLRALQTQAHEAGVRLDYEQDVTSLDGFDNADLIVASDGVNSTVRRLLEPAVTTTVDLRSNRFVWLGTTKPFPAFTFYFRETEHGLWRVHAYQYQPGASTFIVECREETWRASGMDCANEHETAEFLGKVLSEELAGHRLITNRSFWRQFPTICTRPWSTRNIVLLGDAAHTAHFSVGSGTRMAMEDAIALRNSLDGRDLSSALAAYETIRRPKVEGLQRAAQASLEWFENAERFMTLDPVEFTISLLTRSARISRENLRVTRDSIVRQ